MDIREAIKKSIKKNGVYNTFAQLPDVLRELGMEHEEGSDAREAYNRAGDVLEAACYGMDLPYASCSSFQPFEEDLRDATQTMMRMLAK